MGEQNVAYTVDGQLDVFIDLTVRNMMGEVIYEDSVRRGEKVLVHIMRIAQMYHWKPASIQLLFEGELVPAGHYDIITQAPGLRALTFLCIRLPEPELYDESYYCDVCGQLRFCFFRYERTGDDRYVTCAQCGGRYTIPGEDDASEEDEDINDEVQEDDEETIDYPSDVDMDRDQ